MKTALTIQEKLKDLRVERGLKLEELAKETQISKSALGNYEADENKDISHNSIVVLAKFYDVSADYLLGLTENKEHSNTELSKLHLSDYMIDLLTSGRLNNRLLCEMAAHEDFVKLLADIEIYVDRIAGMQIQNLNAWVDMAREQVIKKYNPSENDLHVRTLNAAKIDEDEYFQLRVHDDINRIIRDIREAHKEDSASGSESDPLEEMKKIIAEADKIKGSPQEKQIFVLCRRMGINYKALTDLEFRVLIQVLKKSKLLKSPISQRGKRRK